MSEGLLEHYSLRRIERFLGMELQRTFSLSWSCCCSHRHKSSMPLRSFICILFNSLFLFHRDTDGIQYACIYKYYRKRKKHTDHYGHIAIMREKAHRNQLKCTPKVRHQTFGVHFSTGDERGAFLFGYLCMLADDATIHKHLNTSAHGRQTSKQYVVNESNDE